jgi:hypothetical protein
MNDEAGLARKSTAVATSPGSAARCCGEYRRSSERRTRDGRWATSRSGRSGCHCVDADSVRRTLGRERPGQVVHGGLGGVVRRLPLGPVDDVAGHRPDVDDDAARRLDHPGAEDMAAVPHASEVRVQHRLPLVLRHLELQAASASAPTSTPAVPAPRRALRSARSVLAMGRSSRSVHRTRITLSRLLTRLRPTRQPLEQQC